jgi:methyl-accepting chemotaxis protein
MRGFFFIIVTILGLVDLSYSSTRGDVKIIEATENIQYLSQKIATDYFSFYNKPEDIQLKNQLHENINNLQFFISDISDTTNNIRTKDILDYFTYRIEQIKQLPNQKINDSNARLILKYSEVLLEGAKSIAKGHKYNFSKEEKMLMTSKEIQYLMERATKYYMAFQVGLDSNSNYEQMKKAIVDIDKNIEEINLYNYPHETEKKLKKVNRVWKINRFFLVRVKESPIPHLLLDSTTYMKQLLKDIEQYHKKNL